MGGESNGLGTPLSAIRWNLEILNEDKNLSLEQKAKLTSDTLSESQKMSEIIESLLTLISRREPSISPGLSSDAPLTV